MNTANVMLYSVISSYLLLMLVIAWWSGRAIKSLEDFLVAGRRLGLLLATATMFATCFCAGSAMGISGQAYKYGFMGVIADPFGMSMALVLTGLFYAVAFRRLNLLTVLDVFGICYGKRTEIFAAVLTLPVYVGWLGSMMVATGLIISHLIGIDPSVAIMVGAVVILVYTCIGGMWAITLTDFFQMIILLVGIILIVPFALSRLGGITELIENTPSEFFRLFPAGSGSSEWLEYIGKWMILGLSAVVGQDLIQRSLSSRDEFVARWSALLAGIIYFIMGLLVIFVGLSGRILFPEMENAEQIMPVMAHSFLSPFLLAIFLSGLIAAIMSSADSSLIAASSLFTNNIFRHLRRKTFTDKSLLRISRLTVICIMVLSLFIALYVQQVYNLAINACATLLICIFVPATVGLFFKKYACVEGCWLSMCAGLAVWIGYIIFHTGSFDISDSEMGIYYIAAFYGFCASITGYVSGAVFRFQIKKKLSHYK